MPRRAAIPTLLVLPLALALAACGRDEPAGSGGGEQAAAPAATGAARAAADAGAPAAGIARAAVVDARPLVGQGEAGVRTLLGTPLGCEEVPGGRRCRYAQAGAEVLYIDGMADHIVINDLAGAPFEPATIGRIGLAGAEPLEVGQDAIRWQNEGGMRSIVLERGPDGRAGRLVIKAMTP